MPVVFIHQPNNFTVIGPQNFVVLIAMYLSLLIQVEDVGCIVEVNKAMRPLRPQNTSNVTKPSKAMKPKHLNTLLIMSIKSK